MEGTDMDLRRWRIMGLATVLALLPVAAWAHEADLEGDAALARGLNLSILFLLSMPIAIVGVIFGTVYLTQKRAQRQVCQGLVDKRGRGHQPWPRQQDRTSGSSMT